MGLRPFHLAVPVNSLKEAREFYGGILQLSEGRSSERWIDYDMMGHQFVVHLDETYQAQCAHNPVDGHAVPTPHFGVVLTLEDWEALAERLRAANVAFIIEPTIRFRGQPGEQATMFFKDPSGNALEFKALKDLNALFATT